MRFQTLEGTAARREGAAQAEMGPPGWPENSPRCTDQWGRRDMPLAPGGRGRQRPQVCTELGEHATRAVRAAFKSQRGFLDEAVSPPLAGVFSKTRRIWFRWWGFVLLLWGSPIPHANPAQPHPEALAKSPQTSAVAAEGAAMGCGQDKRESVSRQEGQEERKQTLRVISHSYSQIPPLFSQL